MTDPKQKLEQISDFGDTVGTSLGNIVRKVSKQTTVILVIVVIGTIVFIASVIRSAIKKKEDRYANL